MLRQYQTEAIQKLREALRLGYRRPVMQAPTGAGKTVIASAIIEMARNKGKKVLFCVPALSLINQSVERFEERGIYEIGVIQAMHERTDHTQPVQVCSVQTLNRRTIPKADLVIIDEAHVNFKFYQDWFNDPEWKNVPFIGLTATPWAKGMGKIWDHLIICTTTQELIDLGHLSDFKTFAPSHPDLSKVKTVAGDYDLKGLGDAMDKNTLTADIVSTWIEKGRGLPTILFAVNRAHAQNLKKQFETFGVKAAYMDAYTDLDERKAIAKQFADGDVEVVCNVGVLTTGVDWDVRCIILARPTKSEILYTQMIGRGLRTAKGKDHCLILDHSDTTLRLGFVTDIYHDELDDGKKKQAKKQEKKERLPKECPKCSFLKPIGVRKCPVCAHEPEPYADIDHCDGELLELTKQKKQIAKDWTIEQKDQFYRELIGYTQMKGFKSGWAYWTYKDRLGVGPSNKFEKSGLPPSEATLAWIRHRNIAKAKAKEKQNGYKGSGKRSVAGNFTSSWG